MKLFSALFMFFSSLFPLISAVEILDSPVGKRLDSWLEAFNSGEKEKIEDFSQYFKDDASSDGTKEWYYARATGGLTLKKVEKASSNEFIGYFQKNDSDGFIRLILEVESEPPYLITKLESKPMEAPEEFKVARMSEVEAIKALNEKLHQLAQKDKFSGSVLIAKNGKPIFSYSSGFADRENQVLNSLNTKYNLGSMNKMFTAIAIASLAEKGKLDFSDSLIKHLPDYPNPEFAKVTIHHLLTHTGGTGDIFGPEYAPNIENLKDPANYITLYGNRSLEFEPGSQFRYSNYGYVLLGTIIEKVSGKSYYDYIQETIFHPLGMSSSGSYWKTQETENLAIGYTFANGLSLEKNDYFLPMRGSPAGGGYSTTEDILKFGNGLINNKLLSKEHTNLVTTGKIDLPNEMYAYGFRDKTINGLRGFGHSGGGPGINSTLRIYPNSGYMIIVMGNFDPSAADLVADFIELRLPRQ